MTFKEGFKLVQKAYSEKDREKWFQTWLVRQPDDGKYIIPFETWYGQLVKQDEYQKKSKNISDEELLEKSKDIRRRAEKQ